MQLFLFLDTAVVKHKALLERSQQVPESSVTLHAYSISGGLKK